MKRKIFTLIMFVMMIITLLPASAFAEGEDVPVPEEAEWIGQYDLKGIIGSSEIDNLDTSDIAGFKIKYSDGSEKDFVCRCFEYNEGEDEPTITWAYYDTEYCDESYTEEPLSNAAGFVPEVLETESNPVEFKEGWNDVTLLLKVPYVVSGKGTEDEVVGYKSLTVDVRVLCAPERPVAVEFVPAPGFTPKAHIGINYLDEEAFYGEGNKFIVTIKEWDNNIGDYKEYPKPYYYKKGINSEGEEDEGFFYSDDIDLDHFTLDYEEVKLKKGLNEVEFTYYEYVDKLGEEFYIPFTVTLDVQKYGAYSNDPSYEYTGKVISPKFKMYNTDGDLIPADQYTYTAPKNKKIGWYEVEIQFKDEYKDDYLTPVMATYNIIPKKPVLKKVTGGKKSLTVVWKKLTSSQLNNIDAYYIEIAQDKKMTKGYKAYKLSRKAVKACKKTIKKLKKGKKYYVRMYAVKNVRQDGTSYQMMSNDSAKRAVKTK